MATSIGHATGVVGSAAKSATTATSSPSPATTPQPATALEAGGYSIDGPRTRRALNEKLDVRFATVGPLYEVRSESGNTYDVDIEATTCTCPDFEQRQPDDGCKHLRRVDLEIRTGLVPAPDGTFSR